MGMRQRFRLLFGTRRGWLFLLGVIVFLAVGTALLPANWWPALPLVVLLAAIWFAAGAEKNR